MPAFMSAAPRPYSRSPSTRGSNGGCDQSRSAPTGTTSMWPFRISDLPRTGPAGVWMPTTLWRLSYGMIDGE